MKKVVWIAATVMACCLVFTAASCGKQSSGTSATGDASDNPVRQLKGKEIKCEQYSVSHYLVLRALELNGMKENDVTIVNTPGDEAGQLFLTGGADVVATWNPNLFLAEEQGKGTVIFSSKDIPGEIIDLIVFDKSMIDKKPEIALAVTYAWYDAMEYFNNTSTKEDAIKIMADAAGASVEDFKKMLRGTDLYVDPLDASDFFNSQTILETEEKVKAFSKAHDLIQTDVNLSLNSTYIDHYIKNGGLVDNPASEIDPTPYKVGISIWTGWMPFWLIEAKGFLEKRCRDFGVNVTLEKYKEYMASVESFTARNVVGCSMTIMEALQPANSGIAVEAVVVNDISNGGDGILVKK
ncbi:MAG: ABC transporter substrate-binding protein [Spirochaetales bacterium]|nr:ABC transporter substrate-binding protein [Spirochaetales bacterium]